MMAAAATHTSEPLLVPSSPLSLPPATAPSGQLEAAAKAAVEESSSAGEATFTSPLGTPLPAAAAALVAPAAEPADDRTVPTAPPSAATKPQAAKPSTARVEKPRRKRKGTTAGLVLLVLAALAAAAGLGLRSLGEPEAPPVVATETAGPMPPPHPAAASASTAAATEAPPAPSAAAPGASAAPVSPASDELPPGAEVPPGFGLIEIAAPAGARIRVDGAILGKGPSASSVAAPGYHDVRVESGGHEGKSVVEVRAGKVARVELTQLP